MTEFRITLCHKKGRNHPTSLKRKDSPLASVSWIKAIVSWTRRTLVRAKIDIPVTLQNSYTTHRIERGIALRYIQEILGHNSSKTTLIYIRYKWERNTGYHKSNRWYGYRNIKRIFIECFIHYNVVNLIKYA